jgi:hypothetical protein
VIAGLLLAGILASNEGVTDYFPVEPGTKWIYSSQSGNFTERVTVEALATVTIGSVTAYPFLTRTDTLRPSTMYYTIEGSTVALIGYDPKRPFEQPRPILRMEGPKTQWEYRGFDDAMPLHIKAQLERKGKRKILDREVDVVELKLDAVLGDSKSGMRFKQQAFYGKGIGLAEMNDEQTVGRRKTKTTMKLVQFEPVVK